MNSSCCNSRQGAARCAACNSVVDFHEASQMQDALAMAPLQLECMLICIMLWLPVPEPVSPPLTRDVACMQEHCYARADFALNDDQAGAEGPVPVEILNSMTSESMPADIIKLKAGCMVMLMRKVHRDIGLWGQADCQGLPATLCGL